MECTLSNMRVHWHGVYTGKHEGTLAWSEHWQT